MPRSKSQKHGSLSDGEATPGKVTRLPVTAFVFAALPGLVALIGQFYGNPLKPPPPPAAEARKLAAEAVEPTAVAAEEEPEVSVDPEQDILNEYMDGRVSSALARARSLNHPLTARLEAFEKSYAAALEARSAGEKRLAIRHFKSCMKLDMQLSNGRGKLSPILRRQLKNMRSADPTLKRSGRGRIARAGSRD